MSVRTKTLNIIAVFLVIMSTLFIFSAVVSAGENSGENISQQHDSLALRPYMKNFINIPVCIFGEEIFTRDRSKLSRNIIFAGTLGGTLLLDRKIRDFTRDNIYSGDNLITNFLYNIGTVDYAAKIYGLTLVGAGISGDVYLRDTMLISLQSLLITQVFTETARNVARRARPRRSPDDHLLRVDGGDSFFSGHASGTWSVATVIGERYPRYKKGIYGLAAAVAAARIYEDAHWASDVLAGSAAGYGIGKLTFELNSSRENNLYIKPGLQRESLVFSASWKF